MKRLVVDLDGTLTVESDKSYADKEPNLPLVARLREYKARGYEIVIFTSRNMRTYETNVGKINVHTLPTILDWLARHEVPHDEVLVGKPWCGFDGFYIDDRCVRPDEFVGKSPEQLEALFKRGGEGC
ncbi:capsular biosynthesis protein [Solimonas sp. K1W22B-7]|uniref:HAD hydrolase family protein n=1 Tax=Solimonas sp. K1W22B-7 TaxID=2303331 RepID=UPI000E334FBE|nr:HAD hydrolase family protein [Solimonas sp. K1W22B-7]AXQ29913.1 capsular biosynthesis protein [Solimonas sp. K1W22B-7]